MTTRDIGIHNAIHTLTPGQIIDVHARGAHLYVRSVSSENLQVLIDDGSPIDLYQGILVKSKNGLPFKKVQLYNKSGSVSLSIHVILSTEELVDSSVVVSGTVVIDNTSNAISTPATLSVNNSTGQTIAENTSRKELILQNNGTVNVRAGDSNTSAARGQRIRPGKSLILTTTAAVKVVAESGTQSVDYMELTR